MKKLYCDVCKKEYGSKWGSFQGSNFGIDAHMIVHQQGYIEICCPCLDILNKGLNKIIEDIRGISPNQE